MANSHRICSVSACGKPAVARQLCSTHYAQWKRARDKAAGVVRVSTTPCSIPGCELPRKSKGYCIAHYTRFLRHGDPNGGGTGRGEPLKWIEDHINYDDDECLPWPYATGGRGEAVISFRGRTKSASAVMCILANGEPPTPKHEAAHNCGKGHLGCMNPNHLRWATRKENMADKHVHGTAQTGEKNPRHILKEEDARYILSSDMKGVELALLFKVTTSTISAIRKRRNWKWLE